LNESGARTGKTHSELVKAWHCAETYPGSRQLFARETRKALTETVLPDWENKILGRGHPAIGKARRNNRDAYHFPNGSDIILHGLDDPENILSGEFDRIFVFQAEQLTRQDTWDALLSRLSGSATPYCQATADANPGGERHWLIKRVDEVLCLLCSTIVDPGRMDCQACGSIHLGRMRHFAYRHTDNPLWYDWKTKTWTQRAIDYIVGSLGRLRGTRRKRLLLHQWVSDQGLVLEDYDPEIHRISGKLEQTPSGSWQLTVTSPGWSKGSKDPMREAVVHLDWFGGGADWGFSPHPGVLQIWGYDRFGRRFRVAEVYKTNQQLDWWAGVAHELWKEFKFRYIAVDPSAPAMKDAFNRRIGVDHQGPAIAISADNTIRRQEPDLAGIDLMRWGLRDPNGMVRTFLLRDAQRYGIDAELHDAGLPTCLEDEIPEWVFERKKSTDKLTDKPDEQCANHGLDCWRYECAEGWGVREAATIGAPKYPSGSAGEIHRHDEKMTMARARRDGQGG
jgi:phage terminase large subunit